MVYMIATCIGMYSRYMIISCYWYGYSRYWTWELLICDMWNPTSIVPVSRYIVPVSRYIFLCYQQSSGPGPVIMLHVSGTVFVFVISNHKDNLGMGETWRLIRSYRVMYWIHIVSPTAGDGSATYQLLHELLLLDYCSPLSGGPWSQQPGVCLRPWSRVCTGYTYPIRTPRPWVSN